jgi:hypothetical protein
LRERERERERKKKGEREREIYYSTNTAHEKQAHTARLRAQDSQAQRSGRAQRRRGF